MDLSLGRALMCEQGPIRRLPQTKSIAPQDPKKAGIREDAAVDKQSKPWAWQQFHRIGHGNVKTPCYTVSARRLWTGGRWGGTCLNPGCTPSKLLTAPADRAMKILEASKPGTHAEIKEIDFQGVMEGVRIIISKDRHAMR